MKGLHHVGITVKDLDASIRFYHDVLGLQFSNEPSPWFDGPELGPAVGVPGAALRQASLLSARGHRRLPRGTGLALAADHDAARQRPQVASAAGARDPERPVAGREQPR